jgi:serine phosphatase RsbU (regulator of sigma subunit)
MGDSASLVDSIEIRPLRPQPPQVAENAPHTPRPEAPQAPPGPGDVGTKIADTVMKDVAKKVSKEAAAEIAADAAEENADEEGKSADDEKMPIVIDLPAPAMQVGKRFTLTDEQRRQLDQIQRLGMELGLRGKQMTPAERESLEKRLADTQKAFETLMKQRSEEFDAQHVNVILKSREMARTMAREMRVSQARDRLASPHPAGPVPPVPPATAPGTSAPFTSPPAPAVAGVAPSAAAAPAAAATPVATAPAPSPVAHKITTADRARLSEKEKQTTLVFGQRFNAPLRQQGKVVGNIQAHVSTEEVIRRVLGVESEDRTEVAFALDRDGNLYTRSPEDKQTLAGLGVPQRVAKNESLATIPNWVVVLNRDPQSGLRIGVARPVGDTFEAMRRTAAKNFGFGMGVVLLLLFGIAPIANHMTRDVNAVTRGAERVAQGDLMTRVPVGSTKSEIGQLAVAFNRMAEDLSLQQQRIVTQERERQEQSLQRRLLEVEYARKSSELEEARRFQLSLLPKEVPRHEHFDLAVFTRTATEVGGDYYDFHRAANGVLSATVGDATGHGARAGTMVTVIKALFSGYASDAPPSVFLREASEKVKRMELPRMAMALLVARLERNRVTLASAGMPPVYVHRAASDTVDEIALHATPLGMLGDDYKDAVIELASGDTMLLMTDGFPELLQGSNGTSQQLGYTGAMEDFAVAAKASDVDGVIASLETSVQRWHGDTAPNDDVTFVVVRARA